MIFRTFTRKFSTSTNNCKCNCDNNAKFSTTTKVLFGVMFLNLAQTLDILRHIDKSKRVN